MECIVYDMLKFALVYWIYFYATFEARLFELHCLRWLRGLCSINQGDVEHSARYFIPDVFLSQHSLLKSTRPWRKPLGI